MPGVQGKSLLMAKYGKRASDAAQKTAAAEPEFDSFGDLPAGIVGGVAQLVDCRIMPIAEGKKNAGELMFFARAIVKSPTEHNGVQVRGLGTSIMQNLYDDIDEKTKQPIPGRTMEDKLLIVQEHVKRIANVQPGVPFDPTPFYAENLEATCAHLKAAQPHIRFRTWKGSEQAFEERNGKWFVMEGEFRGQQFISSGKLASPFAGGKKGIHPPGGYSSQQAAQAAFPYAGKPSRVNHVWSGAVEWTGDAPAGSGVRDSTPPANGKHTPEATPAGYDLPVDQPPADDGSDGSDTVDGIPADLSDLLHRAKLKEEGGLEEAEAQTELLERAQNAGVAQEVIDGPSWDDLVEAIVAAESGATSGEDATEDAEEAAEEPAPDGPKVGDLYFIHWPLDAKGKPTVNPKTKKPVKLEVEVASVDLAEGIVTVKDLNTTKPVLGGNKRPRPFKFEDLLDGR